MYKENTLHQLEMGKSSSQWEEPKTWNLVQARLLAGDVLWPQEELSSCKNLQVNNVLKS